MLLRFFFKLKKMKYFYYVFLIATLYSCDQAEEASSDAKPNIILIVADDLGYMDIQKYAKKNLRY